jgi:hypothetical protein
MHQNPIFPLLGSGARRIYAAMKAAFAFAAQMPTTDDIRARALAAFNAGSAVAASDVRDTRRPRLVAIAGGKKKTPRGGSDGGPPAGMVMPDMSIGNVPIYV